MTPCLSPQQPCASWRVGVGAWAGSPPGSQGLRESRVLASSGRAWGSKACKGGWSLAQALGFGWGFPETLGDLCRDFSLTERGFSEEIGAKMCFLSAQYISKPRLPYRPSAWPVPQCPCRRVCGCPGVTGAAARLISLLPLCCLSRRA